MANIPTQDEIKVAHIETLSAVKIKQAQQQAEGKVFEPTDAGVIPEEVWTEQKA